jgi:hypothetical protein
MITRENAGGGVIRANAGAIGPIAPLRSAPMDSTPFRERRFPPAEVRRILKSAAALAEDDAATPGVERPLTQDELTRLGAELGLPETSIRRAIAGDAEGEPAQAAAPRGRRLLFEEEIDGEIDPERFEDVAEALLAATGDPGRAQVIGRTFTWSPTPAMNGGQARKLTVTVRARDGKTRVRVEEDLQQMFLALYLGIGLGMGLGGGLGIGVPLAIALHSLGLALAVVLGVALFAYALPTVIYRAIHRSRVRDLSGLHTKIVKAVREATASEAKRGKKKARIAAPAREETARDEEAEREAEAEAEQDRAARTEKR